MYIYLFVAKVQCPKAGRTEGLTLTEVHGKGERGGIAHSIGGNREGSPCLFTMNCSI